MLFRKMLRDISWNKMQFISIFLLAFLGVYAYAGIGGETVGIKNIRDSFNEETNLANAWIYGENFNDEALEKVKNVQDVEDAERRLYLTSVGEGEKKPTINMYFQESNTISMPKVVEGSEYDPKDTSHVWIDKRFADANDLKIGDDYTFDINGVKLSLKIGGMVYSSEYTYYTDGEAMMPDFSKVGIAFASYDAFPHKEYIESMIKSGYLSPDFNLEKIPYSQIIFTTDESDVASLEDKISDALNGKYSHYITRDSVVGVNQLNDEMIQHESMMIIFAIAFVAIAILAIITTMNRMVNNQRTQIGTMKALGMSKGKIVRHYMAFSFWISLIGSVLGVVLGPITIPELIFPSMSSGYTLPEWKGGYDISFVLVAVITVVMCTITTYFSCRKILSVNPAETLRPAAPKEGKKCIFEKLSFWNKLSFSTQYNLRDFARSKVRCLMGFAGTLCCMALLVCSASMYDSFDNMYGWLYNDIQNYDNRVVLKDEATLKDAENLTNELNGEMVMEDSAIVKVDGTKKTMQFTAAEGKGLQRITNSDLDIETLKDDGFAMTQKTAKTLGVKSGDTIEWHLLNSEDWIKSKVTVINRIPVGYGITTTREYLEKTDNKYIPTYIATDKNKEDINNSAIKQVITKDDMTEAWDTSMESMTALIGILIAMAILLGILILYNLGLLAYAEREREMATLKVVGFNTAKLRKMLLKQNTWLSVLGIIAGTPAGIWMVQYIIDIMGDAYDMTAVLSLPSFILCSAGTLIVSVIVSMMFSKKIKRLDMVTSLKGVE